MTTSSNPELSADGSSVEASDTETDTTGESLLTMYLRQIGKIALLTKEEEQDLSIKIEAGLFAQKCLEGQMVDVQENGTVKILLEEGQLTVLPDGLELLQEVAEEGRAAKQRMLESNLRLVVSIAKRYRAFHDVPGDLIQEGNLGLIRAVEKFDYTKGHKFSTYATWWIRQAVERAIPDIERVIRLPVHQVAEVNKLRRVEHHLWESLGRAPTERELAEEFIAEFTGKDAFEKALQKVREVRQMTQHPVFLNKIVDPEGDVELGEVVIDSEEVPLEEIISFQDVLMPDKLDALAARLKLNERNWEITKAHFGIGREKPLSFAEIGLEHDITRERARQILLHTLQKIRLNRPAAETLKLYYE